LRIETKILIYKYLYIKCQNIRVKIINYQPVKYYLDNNVSLDDICEIFDYLKQSLYMWIKRYNELEEIKKD
jgi:hypothetical protein